MQTEKRPRYGLMSAGLSILGGLWVISMSTGIVAERYELIIPVAGPFITAHDLGNQYAPSPGRTMLIGLVAMDGIFQTAGLIMAIAGGATRVAVPKRRAPSVYPYGTGVYGRF
jgi:hypothetical protein